MRIRNLFTQLKSKEHTAFIPFIAGGDPDLATTEAALFELQNIGADIIELGVPYSDPVADGPTIAAAYARALRNNTTIIDCCALVERARKNNLNVPIILFTYFNMIFNMGISAFAQLVAKSGIDAVLVVDLPLDEIDELQQALKQNNVGIILLAAPNTSNERLKKIANKNPEFIYYISRKGVTGVQSEISNSLHDEIHHLRTITDLPIAVGFGISTPEQCASVASVADGVVIGSALVKCLEPHPASVNPHSSSLSDLCMRAQTFRKAIK